MTNYGYGAYGTDQRGFGRMERPYGAAPGDERDPYWWAPWVAIPRGASYLWTAVTTGADVAARAGQAAVEQVQEQARAGFDRLEDYATTPLTESYGALALAARGEVGKLQRGTPATAIGMETHGVMLTAPVEPTGAAAGYRSAYWLAFAGRRALARGAVDVAQRLGARAVQRLGEADRSAAAGWAASVTGFGRGGLAGFGGGSLADVRLLRNAGLDDVADTLAAVNAPAARAYMTRMLLVGGAIVGGAALVAGGVTVAAKRRKGRSGAVRRNGRPRKSKLTPAQRAKQLRGIALLASGGLLMSPADEGLVTALTAGLGLPIVPVQGGATLAGGAILAGAGIYTLATVRR
jgi:hypothetical protein